MSARVICVRLRPQHEIAGAFAQPGVVDQQVAHLDFARDPRIIHLEVRQVTRDWVFPPKLAAIDQASEQGRGHRLAVRGNLEERVCIDGLLRTGDGFTGRSRIDHVAIAHDPDRDARQAIARDDVIDDSVQARGVAIRPRFPRAYARYQRTDADERRCVDGGYDAMNLSFGSVLRWPQSRAAARVCRATPRKRNSVRVDCRPGTGVDPDATAQTGKNHALLARRPS